MHGQKIFLYKNRCPIVVCFEWVFVKFVSVQVLVSRPMINLMCHAHTNKSVYKYDCTFKCYTSKHDLTKIIKKTCRRVSSSIPTASTTSDSILTSKSSVPKASAAYYFMRSHRNSSKWLSLFLSNTNEHTIIIHIFELRHKRCREIQYRT